MKLLDKIRQGASEASVLELHQGIHLLNDEIQRKNIRDQYDALRKHGITPEDAKQYLADRHGKSTHMIHHILFR